MPTDKGIGSDDIILWPDGEWCFGEELSGFSWKSDDYEIIRQGTERWTTLIVGGSI